MKAACRRTPNMVRDGIPFVVGPLVIAVISAVLAFWLVWFWIGTHAEYDKLLR